MNSLTHLTNILNSVKNSVILKAEYSDTELVHIFKIFVEKITQIPYSNLSMFTAFQLNLEQQNILNLWIEKLEGYHPFQQIVGETDFLNLVLKINEFCLIPRPETEDLVLESLKYIQIDNTSNVLDIGTGSGCIAISIKKNRPQTEVFAIESDEHTLKLMVENAQILQCIIHTILQDFLIESHWLKLPNFDFIISNPPYIPKFKQLELSKRVIDFEPHQALFVPNETPLIFYEKIILFARKHLKMNGYIFLEFEQDFANEIYNLFVANGFVAEIKKDRFFCDRILIAHKKNVSLPK